MASMVEWFACPRCPFALKETTEGKSVEINYAKTMLCIAQAFLINVVGNVLYFSLSLELSINFASLKKSVHHCRRN